MNKQTCIYCENINSILTKETCCSGCSKILDAYFYQPERSKREDPHLNLDDIENMTIDQMKIKLREMEDIILRQYIQMTSCWICPKCVGCGALNSMET